MASMNYENRNSFAVECYTIYALLAAVVWSNGYNLTFNVCHIVQYDLQLPAYDINT